MKFFLLSICLLLNSVCLASSPLSTKEETKKIALRSKAIFKGKVISKYVIWTHNGEVISEKDARSIETAILEYQNDFQERFGIANEDSKEAIEYRSKWLNTDMGKKSLHKVECLIVASFQISEVSKGEEASSKVVSASWNTGILQTCSSVGVNTEVGSRVNLYFIGEVPKSISNIAQVGYESLLIGSRID